jgi:uncharacterized protein (DUF1778 family)
VPTSISKRAERIDLRLTGDLKALLARAASYSGMSLSSFLISVASDRAREVVAEHETLILSAQDWNAFLLALDNVDRPRPMFEAAVQRYRNRRKGSDAG